MASTVSLPVLADVLSAQNTQLNVETAASVSSSPSSMTDTDVSADEPVLIDEPQPETSPLEWITEQRNYWGQYVTDTGKRIDRFFADEETIDNSNASFLKFSLASKYAKQGELDIKPRVKFRLDLPTLEEKYRFSFESEPSENRTLEESALENTLTNDEGAIQETVGAFKLSATQTERLKLSSSVGIDFDFPLDYFWRAKMRYKWPIAEHWSLRTDQSIYYFHRQSWGERTKFTFDYDTEHFVLRSKSQVKYIHLERRFEFSQIFGYLKELSDVRAINYQIGVLGENKPERKVTGYFTNLIYRRKLSKDWLFYEMIPEVYFPRYDSFKANPSFTIKLEIVFSANK